MHIAYHVALERGLAELIQQFQDAPDLFLREADLHAAAYAALEREPLLRARYATRDGRWTGLLHCAYPPLLACETFPRENVPTFPRSNEYDLVLLNPGFVRAHDRGTVANTDPQRAARLRALPAEARPRPLLAAINLTLIDLGAGLKPAPTIPVGVLVELEADCLALARSKAEAERAYLGVFCRHWDLDPTRPILQALGRWADEHPCLSIVFLQAYRDDVGRVAGGRYFNLWSHMAPLMPLGGYQ